MAYAVSVSGAGTGGGNRHEYLEARSGLGGTTSISRLDLWLIPPPQNNGRGPGIGDIRYDTLVSQGLTSVFVYSANFQSLESFDQQSGVDHLGYAVEFEYGPSTVVVFMPGAQVLPGTDQELISNYLAFLSGGLDSFNPFDVLDDSGIEGGAAPASRCAVCPGDRNGVTEQDIATHSDALGVGSNQSRNSRSEFQSQDCDVDLLTECIEQATNVYEEALEQAWEDYKHCYNTQLEQHQQDMLDAGWNATIDTTVTIFTLGTSRLLKGALRGLGVDVTDPFDRIEELYEAWYAAEQACKDQYQVDGCSAGADAVDNMVHCFRDYCPEVEEEVGEAALQILARELCLIY
ncbi:MAG: hypothetical protein MK102_07765 [Fuerstiella sp.]|nr:hypothetical protein [Fuerstiella sp.]